MCQYHRIDELVAAGYHLLSIGDKYVSAVTPPPNEKYILFRWVEERTARCGGYWVVN